MKKIFVTVLATLILISGFTYAQEVGQEQYITERFNIYGYTPSQADIDYWSTITRNEFGVLEENLQRRFSQNKFAEEIPVVVPFADKQDEIFGASPKRPSEFKSNLAEQKTEGHANTTLKVTTITTKDGNTLDGSVLGDLIVLSINPGGSNSEIVVCTGLTTATKTFTGCTFGYRFDNPTATQSANIEAHAPGEPVIISDSDTYLVQQYVTIDGDETFLGSKAFASTTEPITRLYFGSNRGAYFWYNTTTDQFGWASSTDEFQFNSSGTQFTPITPLSLTSGELKLATTTNHFTLTGGLLSLFLNGSISANSSGLAVATTSDFSFTGNFKTASTTVSSKLLVSGNATTTGTLDVRGDLCFDGTECVTENFTTNYFATSSDHVITTLTANTWLRVTATTTISSISAGDIIETRLFFDVGPDAGSEDAPIFAVLYDNQLTNLTLVAASASSENYYETQIHTRTATSQIFNETKRSNVTETFDIASSTQNFADGVAIALYVTDNGNGGGIFDVAFRNFTIELKRSLTP